MTDDIEVSGNGKAVHVSTSSVLQNRHFLFLWMAQAVSQTAQNAIWFGLMVVVEEATHSTTQLGLAVLTTILPSIALGMIAGVFVDRINKKTVLVTTNLLRGVAVLGFLLYNQAVYFVYLINLVFCSISQFFGPAEAASIPMLVPKRQLITANSLFNLTFTGSQIAGLVIFGPPLIKLFGANTLFIAAALAYGVAAVLVSFLPRGNPPERPLSTLRRETVVTAVWTEVKEGWGFIAGDARTALAMVHLTLISGLVLVISMLAPRFVVAVLGIRADDAVFMFAPTGIGILLGTMSAGRLSNRFGKRKVINRGLVTLGVCMFVLAALRLLSMVLPPAISALTGASPFSGAGGMVPSMLVLASVMGFSFALVTIPAQTVIMERAPVATRGRIFAVQMMLGNLVAVVPLLFLGGIADLFGVDATLGLVALCILIVAAYSIKQSRLLDRVTQPVLTAAGSGNGTEEVRAASWTGSDEILR